jgi:hypothetical protein
MGCPAGEPAANKFKRHFDCRSGDAPTRFGERGESYRLLPEIVARVAPQELDNA